MRIVLFALLAVAMAAFTAPAGAAKSGAKNTNSRACASIRSDMRHKGGGYIPAGVKCGKRKAA